MDAIRLRLVAVVPTITRHCGSARHTGTYNTPMCGYTTRDITIIESWKSWETLRYDGS